MFYIHMLINKDCGLFSFKQRQNSFKRNIYNILGSKKIFYNGFQFFRKVLRDLVTTG